MGKSRRHKPECRVDTDSHFARTWDNPVSSPSLTAVSGRLLWLPAQGGEVSQLVRLNDYRL